MVVEGSQGVSRHGVRSWCGVVGETWQRFPEMASENEQGLMGRGVCAISARSRRDLGTRPLHKNYVGTEFASITVHMHKVSSKFVKMAPNDDTRGVGGRGHQEGTLNTPRPINFCSSPLTSLSSQLIGMVEWWWWW